jgi:hypothetical protein
MTNHCGTCTACCKVFAIEDSPVHKPAGQWCEHCAVGKGCTIYETRPKTCSTFECLWLQSQSYPGMEMPEKLRPDKCKVVFSSSTSADVMVATTMPGAPDAWDKPEVRKLIGSIVNGGQHVCVGPPASTNKMLIGPNGIKPVKMTPPDPSGMQWAIPETEGATNAKT